MIELPVTLTSTGGAVSFASPVTLGYTKNKGVYRLLVTAEGEWEGLTIRCFWHLPGGTDPASSLVQDGFVDVPASVTAQPGTGCITFEGSDGEKTVTSADLRYKVGSNSGTEDGTMPEPGTPAWEQLVSETKANADAAERAKQDAEAAAKEAENAATKADTAATKAEAAQKATEGAEASAAESIAGAKEDALSAIGTSKQSALDEVQQAQETATEAVQATQTAAESAVNAAKTNAVQEVEAAAKPAQTAAAKAEEAAELSTQAGIAASNAADDAKRSAGIATGAAGDSALNAENAQKSALSAQQSAENAAESQSAAAASADAAAKSAQEALESKTAAATSEGNAAESAKKAKDIADSLHIDYTTAVNDIAALKTNKADKQELETVKQQVANITPDDSTVGEKPWSSKHIIDMLCPPLEESGNPVVCYPVAGYPLGVKAKWEPMQEGSGTPSPENIRLIKGRESVTITRQEDNQVITLTLPETVYGGEVDAVSEDGNNNIKIITLDGNKIKFSQSGNYFNLPVHSAPGIIEHGIICCSHFDSKIFIVNTRYDFCFVLASSLVGLFANIDDLNAYIAAQYAAGTPAQIAYKLATPTPFTATGAQPIPALAGANTVLTDADSATVTGRADPIKRIADLENKE